MDVALSFSFSTALDKIAPAFIIAQGNFGPLKKSADNPFFQSKYADLEAVIDATRSALQAVGIGTLQAPGGDGSTISVSTMLLHESGQYIASVLVLKPTKGDPQSAGSAITYGRRYALQAMCGLAAEDDDGAGASKAAAATRESPPRAQRKPVDDGQRQRVYAMTMFSKLKYSPEQRYDFYEQVAGYDNDGNALKTWESVAGAGRASMVISALEDLVKELENGGFL